MTGFVLLAVPAVAGAANPSDYMTAFQGQNGDLWTVDSNGIQKDWGLGMAPGTNPSIASRSSGEYEIAFQANTGDLWTVGATGSKDWGLGMAPGTSPSVAALPDNGWEVAVQANTGDLWTVPIDSSGGRPDWNAGDYGYHPAPGTSPSITGLQNGGFAVAINSRDANQLQVYTSPNFYADYDAHIPMAPGTSPSITAPKRGGLDVAAQGNDGQLWAGSLQPGGWWGTGPRGLAMASGTSPSITGLAGSGPLFKVAFQSDTGTVWTTDQWGQNTNTGGGITSGTSPSITGLSNGDTELAWNAQWAPLFNLGPISGWVNTGLWMASGTSPSITSYQ